MMSGRPASDDAGAGEYPTEPRWPDRLAWPDGQVLAGRPSSATAIAGPAGPAGQGGAASQAGGQGGAAGHLGAGSAGSAEPYGRRSASGALLPGDWAKPGDWTTGSSTAGGASAVAGRVTVRHRILSRLKRLMRGELRGGRLALAAGGLALACTMLGGVIGGYIALHSRDSQTDPGYTIGTAPPAPAGRPEGSVAGVAARVTPGVVMLKVNGGEGTGSGFIIQGGYIVTDNHVVTLDNHVVNAAIEVYFSNGRSARGEIVGRDPFSDIAIIKAEGVGGLPALSLGNSTGVEVGDPVLAVGSPLGLADTVTSGIVSAVDRPVQPGQATGSSPQLYFDAIQTDAPINPGNSGGPLVNSKGQVIGVDAAIDTLGDNPLTGTQGGSIGLGFAIPINQARRVAVELIRTGHATHAIIGAEVNAGWAGSGAQIMAGRAGITPGGPAALAGLQRGDVVVRFAGLPVANGNALLDAVRSATPGSRVRLTFTRAGQAHNATVRLGSASS